MQKSVQFNMYPAKFNLLNFVDNKPKIISET